MLSAEERADLVERGVWLFNAGRFYDCHEAWETVWRSTTPEPRDLWRGLIQIAVGFYHFHGRRRPDVAARVLRKGARRVEPFAPSSQGLDLAALLASVDGWIRSLEAGSTPRPRVPRLDRAR